MAASPQRPAVFLDRDGVLNRTLIVDRLPRAPRTLAEFQLFPEAPAACRALRAAGFALVVATNQPDVGRGEMSPAALDAIHAALRAAIPEIEQIEVCLAPGRGVESAETRRRKPEPGMLLDAAAALNLDLQRSWMIGDRWRDIDCGRNAGVRTIFIDFHYAESLRAPPDFTVSSLGEAAAIILARA